jgi:CubicO group peptidase (beta-lactamase class C family)
MMQQFVDCEDIAGAVTLVARDGKILEFDAVGYSDLGTGSPMQKDSLFWVASMTKPITSAAVLLLVSEGKIALSDPIEKYLPDFRNQRLVIKKPDGTTASVPPSRPITIRDLLTHTHGLEDPPLPAPKTSLSENVAAIAKNPLQFEPGSQWKYGNAGMNTLGRIVEVVSGQPFEEFLQQTFFTPLGMKDTSFFPEPSQLQNLARSYKRAPQWGSLVETSIGLINGDLTKKEQAVFPGGGLFSTAEDMFRFYQMLLNGGEFEGKRYLPEALVKDMTSPQTGELEAGFSAGMSWGLGVGIVRQPQGWTDCLPSGAWGHDGACGTTVMADPKSKLLFIMMIQHAGLNPYTHGLRFRHAFHSAIVRSFLR